MPTLSITKSYADGEVLFEADLDIIKSDIETFVNTTKLDDDNIQDNGITGSTKIIDGTITAAKIAASAITSTTLATDSITTAKIQDLAVTAAKIADLGVTTGKIANTNVTTAKISDGAVTITKKETPNYVISTGTGASGTAISSTSYTALEDISITVHGGPCYFAIIPKGGMLSIDAPGTVSYQIIAVDDGGVLPDVLLGENTDSSSAGGQIVNSCFGLNAYGILPAGTWNVTLKAKVSTGTATFRRLALLGVELI